MRFFGNHPISTKFGIFWNCWSQMRGQVCRIQDDVSKMADDIFEHQLNFWVTDSNLPVFYNSREWTLYGGNSIAQSTILDPPSWISKIELRIRNRRPQKPPYNKFFTNRLIFKYSTTILEVWQLYWIWLTYLTSFLWRLSASIWAKNRSVANFNCFKHFQRRIRQLKIDDRVCYI